MDAEVKPFEVPECECIYAYMRRSGLEGLRSKKFDGFWDVRAVRHIIAT